MSTTTSSSRSTVHVSTLPPFSNMRARCARCGARYEIRVHFDRGCAEVVGGEHFHRICNCGHRWAERCSEGAATRAPAGGFPGNTPSPA